MTCLPAPSAPERSQGCGAQPTDRADGRYQGLRYHAVYQITRRIKADSGFRSPTIYHFSGLRICAGRSTDQPDLAHPGAPERGRISRTGNADCSGAVGARSELQQRPHERKQSSRDDRLRSVHCYEWIWSEVIQSQLQVRVHNAATLLKLSVNTGPELGHIEGTSTHDLPGTDENR